jgi:hypothetical protein
MRLIAFICLITCCSFVSDRTPEACYKAFREWYTAHHSELLLKADRPDFGLAFELRYLPGEVAICEQILNTEKVSGKQLKSLYETYGVYDEYSFKIISTDSKDLLVAQSEDKAEYQEKQFYLIESVQQDFSLVRDNDTLKPIRCGFENNYGTAPFVTLHLVFEKAKEQKPKHTELIYNDQLFTSETVRFDCTSIMNLQIPKIK